MYVLTSGGGVDVPALGKKWDILRNQRTVGHNNSDSIKIKIFLKLMTGLKGDKRKVEYHLALALALKGKIIDSFEDTTDRGCIIEKLIDKDIPLGMWMGHIWYYPQYKKTYTRLNKEELKKVMKQGDSIREKLRVKISEEYLNEDAKSK